MSSSSWAYHFVNQASPGAGGVLGDNDVSFNDAAHELRLISSKDWSQTWDYVLGVYYARQDEVVSQHSGNGSGAGNFIEHELLRHVAGFGELGYKFTEHWSARLGLRHQTVDFTTTRSFQPGVELSGRNTPTTGRVLTNYDFNNNAMAYASVSKGFRAGGLNSTFNGNTPGTPIPGVPAGYGPDTTTNYEIGAKLSFPSFRATLAAALYHIDWQNIQVSSLAFVPGTAPPHDPWSAQYFHNAGTAKVDGLELEGGMELLQGLQAQASLELMNPVITRDQALPTDNPSAGIYADRYCGRGCPARAGDQIPFVSRVTGSISLNYRHALGVGHFNGFATVSEQYTGPRNTDFARTWAGPSQTDGPCMGGSVTGGGGAAGPPSGTCPRTRNGDVNQFFRELSANILTNVQLGIDNGRWRAALFANNLFDRRNVLGATPSQPPINTNGDVVLVDRPRTMGLWVRYTFE